jgi:hypothetical protein
LCGEHGVSKESDLLRAAEETARAIIDAEFALWEKWSIDDNEHLVRLRTIAMAASDAAGRLGAGTPRPRRWERGCCSTPKPST